MIEKLWIPCSHVIYIICYMHSYLVCLVPCIVDKICTKSAHYILQTSLVFENFSNIFFRKICNFLILKDPPNILVYILHIKYDHLQTPYLNHNSDDQHQHIPAPWLVLSALKYLIISLPYDLARIFMYAISSLSCQIIFSAI